MIFRKFDCNRTSRIRRLCVSKRTRGTLPTSTSLSMFDGIARLGNEPIPVRPNALDTPALLPLLAAQSAEDAVRTLAHVVAINAQATADWIRANWGDDADVRDVAHPVYAAALDPASPAYRLVKAQEALLSACQHYRR